MLLGIDHVVVAVDDPDAAAAALADSLGLETTDGGRHEALGTFNRLVWLGDSYLELLGVFDRGLAATSWLGGPALAALERGGGLVTWAVAIDDLDGQLRWLSDEAGFAGPIDGARTRPDARIVRWRLSHPPDLAPSMPFLIEHDTAAAEWTPAERAERAAQVHPIGGRVRLLGLDLPTPHVAAAAGSLRRLLAASVEPDGRQAVRVVVGRQSVRFAPPAEDAAPPVVELVTDVRVRRRTVRLGDCLVRLTGHAPPTGPGGTPTAAGVV